MKASIDRTRARLIEEGADPDADPVSRRIALELLAEVQSELPAEVVATAINGIIPLDDPGEVFHRFESVVLAMASIGTFQHMVALGKYTQPEAAKKGADYHAMLDAAIDQALADIK